MAYTQTTRAQLRLLLQQRWESTPFWTETDANLALNHTLRVWNLLTGYWRRRISATLIPNDPMVPILGTMVQQTAIRSGGLPMVGVSVAELHMLEDGWWYARTAGRPLIWAPVGLNLIEVWPASTTGQTLEVDGVRQTPVLTADGDLVDVGPEELNTLLGYALHAAAVKAGASFLARTQPGLEHFIEAAVARNHLLKLSRWYTHFHKEGYAWSLIPEAPATGTPQVGP